MLRLTADNGQAKSASTLKRLGRNARRPAKQLDAVYTKNFQDQQPALERARQGADRELDSPLHRPDQPHRPRSGPGGIDNFIEAGKALRGEPHGAHKGYVFSNAWVHQTVEAMSIALMIDPQGDPDIIKAHAKMRATLDEWIPIILAAQEPDGYLQTAFTLPRIDATRQRSTTGPFTHWERRGDHEGYIAGYFLESAINHYLMTGKKDARLYNAAKKLADCWYDNLGPAPKKAWYDGHQEMEQALVRFGRFVNDMEGGGKGDRSTSSSPSSCSTAATTPPATIASGSEYDQSHLPVTQQYEAVGHAVRAIYTYSGMADVAVETHDPDYQSAVKSLWDNIVNKKYYVTGGVGSGETSEGFGPNYSLRNDAYCESCSSCGEIFFQWKMNLAYHDAKYVDLYEETMYNALLGSHGPRRQELLLHQPAGRQRRPRAVAHLPVLRRQHPAHPAHDADLDVRQERRRRVRQPLRRQHDHARERRPAPTSRWCRRPTIPGAARSRSPSIRRRRRRFSVRIRVPDRDVSALYTSTPEVQRHHVARGQRQGGEADDREAATP